MYEAYRVVRPFQWRGYQYAPPGKCTCECNVDEAHRANNDCTGRVGTNCHCPDAAYCPCHIPVAEYGGDIWLVENRHPRKDYILLNRFVTWDPSIPDGDELVKMPVYARLVSLDPRKRLVPA